MADVYAARREEGTFEQRVAIKLLRRGLDTQDLLARFLRERSILARLEHPAIARLIDGGALADGRPYLVMELVDGQPIHFFAEERALERRAASAAPVAWPATQWLTRTATWSSIATSSRPT